MLDAHDFPSNILLCQKQNPGKSRNLMKPEPLLAARVLLVNFNEYDQPYPVYPLGLAYVDGALREDGHVTEIWDVVSPVESLEETVMRFRPDFIGITMRNIDNQQSHNPRIFTRDLLACVAKLRAVSAAPLILGGGGFSIFPQQIHELSGVEFGVVGEGGATIRRLLRTLRGSGGTLSEISGLIFRNSKGETVTVPREREAADPAVPPHHDKASLAAYIQEGSPVGVQTQRGCPLKCCYCTYPMIEGNSSRFRTGEEVAEELACLAACGVRQVFFVDSVFNTSNKHVVDVCEAILRAGVKINWECFLRPSKGTTRELMELMQRAGLNHIEFGSDSFSDPVLRRYGKSFDFEDIRLVSEHANALKIRYTHFIIFGGPGETEATMEETLARAATLPNALYFATVGMRVYPGTPLWRLACLREPGGEPADCLLEPLFHIEPPLTASGIQNRLKEVRQSASNWAIGDPPAAFMETLAKLRRRGKGGNMWEYVELMQRLGTSLQGTSSAAPIQQNGTT
ncbi:MAG: radical SAM protein [Verrucomicrobiaceae bacterium]|nr:MAG: radical SAM protein [Verrucomicrobiaceae bacterium]